MNKIKLLRLCVHNIIIYKNKILEYHNLFPRTRKSTGLIARSFELNPYIGVFLITSASRKFNLGAYHSLCSILFKLQACEYLPILILSNYVLKEENIQSIINSENDRKTQY